MSKWTRFNNWMESNEPLMLVVAIVAVVLGVLALTGCGSDPRGSLPPAPDPAGPGLFAQLGAIGGWFVYIGLLVAGLALVARIAGTFFVPILAPFGSVLGDLVEVGLVAALVGGIFVWLSAHVWLVVLSCLAAGLAWAWYRRAWIRRWIDRIKAQAVKP